LARVRAQRRDVAAARLAEAEVVATSTHRTPSRATSTSSMNADGASKASPRSKRATNTLAMPKARKNSSLARSDVSRVARSAARRIRGMRLEGHHAGGRRKSSAASISRISIA